MKTLHALLALLVIGFFMTGSAFAADLNFDCGSSGCSKAGLDPLFSVGSDGNWFPGKTVAKTVTVTNSRSDSPTFAFKGTKITGDAPLEDALDLVITEGATPVWSGTITNFYAAAYISIGSIPFSTSKDYTYTLTLPASADNSTQNTQSIFDLTLSIWSDPVIGGGGSSGGSSGGGSGSAGTAPQCNDEAPKSAPSNLRGTTGANSVTLTWTEAADPVTYYLVAYGTSPGGIQYGNPNVGGRGTTSYTVTNLSGGTTYYFAVRAGNGCRPGPYSEEIAVTPGGGLVTGVAVGFIEGVLGAEIEEVELTPTPTPTETQTSEATEEGEIAGTTSPNCASCNWLPFALAETILLAGYLWMVGNTKGSKAPYLSPLIPAVIYGIYLLTNGSCTGTGLTRFTVVSGAFTCRYFWLVSILLYAFVLTLWLRIFPQSVEEK